MLHVIVYFQEGRELAHTVYHTMVTESTNQKFEDYCHYNFGLSLFLVFPAEWAKSSNLDGICYLSREQRVIDPCIHLWFYSDAQWSMDDFPPYWRQMMSKDWNPWPTYETFAWYTLMFLLSFKSLELLSLWLWTLTLLLYLWADLWWFTDYYFNITTNGRDCQLTH